MIEFLIHFLINNFLEFTDKANCIFVLMKSKGAKSNKGFKATMSGIAMLSLALMLLVFSCPLKKLLIKETTSTSTVRTHQHRPVNYTHQNIDLSSCLVKNKTELADFTVAKEVRLIPRFSNQSLALSVFHFTLHSLSSTGKFVYTDFVTSHVPLFLQHSQLLI